jgi:hypothetical protein
MSSSEPSLVSRLRTMQIIAAAQVMGASTFLVIVVFLVYNNGGKGQGRPAEGALPVVSLTSAAFLAVNGPLAFLLPGLMLRNARNRLAGHAPDTYVMPPTPNQAGGPISDTDFLLAQRLTTMIVSLALLEGSSFLGSIAYLLEGQWFALAVSALAIGILLTFFPTEDSVRAWLAEQRRALEDLRMRKRMGG